MAAQIKKYVEIVVEAASRKINKSFCYFIPESLGDISIGTRVLIPFGKRSIAGYVVKYIDRPDVDNIKPVKEVLSESLPEDLIDLAYWLSQRYLCSLAESLRCVMGPAKEKKRPKKGVFAVDVEELHKLSAKQQKVLKKAMEFPGLSQSKLAKIAEVSVSTISSMIKKGALKFIDDKGAVYVGCKSTSENRELTSEQKQAYWELKEAVKKEQYRAFLLHGVTGSGKTEVYLRIIEFVIEKGKQAIVLVPEIALTPQMTSAFRERFCDVAILHSKMAAGERYREWLRIKNTEVKVVLGTRSAVFAPVKDLGVVIIDEEHEPTYKQEDNPKYHTRDVAIQRAKMHDAVLVMGSATPSLESYCRAKLKHDNNISKKSPYTLLMMNDRVNNKELPKINVIDMRNESFGIFSRLLLEKIEFHLENNNQVILFLNRRGYASFVVCRQCGNVYKCPRCDISLTYHANGMLRCHYCDYSEKMLNICKQCGCDNVERLGIGTQRIEQEVLKQFPKAKVLRMDADTTSRKDAHEKMFKIFKSGKADILIGTQMIAKGLDIPKVTLVGVVNADTMLYMPDFRAAERTFQLLTQVSGRAGRGLCSGETIIQTYNPDHYSISLAKDQDYKAFYRQEMLFRKELHYPPFYYLARMMVIGNAEKNVEMAIDELKSMIYSMCQKEGIIVTGPAPNLISKIKDLYRWQLIIRGKLFGAVHNVVNMAVKSWREDERFKRYKNKLALSVDIDPQTLI